LMYPDSTIFINETVHLPSETNYIELDAYQPDNRFIDILDQIDFSAKDRVNISQFSKDSKVFTIQNNVIKSGEPLNYQINNLVNEKVKIDLFNAYGKKVCDIYQGTIKETVFDNRFQLKNLNQGIYFVVLTYRGKQFCEKMVVCE